MTDYMKDTVRMSHIKAKIRQAMENGNAISMMKFIASTMQTINLRMLNAQSAFMRIEKGDFGEVMQIEKVEPNQVEDLDEFNRLLERIADEKSNVERMKICARALSTIRETIAAWQSKIDKMRVLGGRSGATASEIATAETKIVMFEETVSALRDRGEIVSRAHEAAKRSLVQFMERDAKNCKLIFAKP